MSARSIPLARSVDTMRVRAGRAATVAELRDHHQLTRRLAEQMDGWFASLTGGLHDGWGLAAVGGYGRGQLFPGSDVDVVLIHPERACPRQVRALAPALWYPIWDGGVKLAPSVHTARSLLALATRDIFTMTSTLEMRSLGGDAAAIERVRLDARRTWRRHARPMLQRLRCANLQRWQTAGEITGSGEPNLKDGRGGLRDVDALRWALATESAEVEGALSAPLEDLDEAAALIAAVRCELHRTTGTRSNILRTCDQGAVAERLGYLCSGELRLDVAAAAHRIDRVSGNFWERIGLGWPAAMRGGA